MLRRCDALPTHLAPELLYFGKPLGLAHAVPGKPHVFARKYERATVALNCSDYSATFAAETQPVKSDDEGHACRTDSECFTHSRNASCAACTDPWQHNWTAGVCDKALPTGRCDGYGCTDANCTTHGHIIQPCQCVPFRCLKPDVTWPAIDWASTLPKYLMIGDSISIQMAGGAEYYSNGSRIGANPDGGVFDLLRNSTQATHNPGNAANSNKGAHCVDSWLEQLEAPDGGCRLDKISFNFGALHSARLPCMLTRTSRATSCAEIVLD